MDSERVKKIAEFALMFQQEELMKDLNKMANAEIDAMATKIFGTLMGPEPWFSVEVKPLDTDIMKAFDEGEG